MNRDIHDLERWIQAHPVSAWFVTAGLAALILEFSILIRYILDSLSRLP